MAWPIKSKTILLWDRTERKFPPTVSFKFVSENWNSKTIFISPKRLKSKLVLNRFLQCLKSEKKFKEVLRKCNLIKFKVKMTSWDIEIRLMYEMGCYDFASNDNLYNGFESEGVKY